MLDEGDEVQLLERSGVYWFVLCPDGQQGWVHKMVLGEVIDEPEDLPGPAARAIGLRQSGEDALAARLATVDVPSPTGWPGGSDIGGHDPAMQPVAWTMRGAAATDAGADVDDDVMRAFMAAQGRARRPRRSTAASPLGLPPEHQDVLVGDVRHERRAGSRTAAAASRPGTRSGRPWARTRPASARAARSEPVNR